MNIRSSVVAVAVLVTAPAGVTQLAPSASAQAPSCNSFDRSESGIPRQKCGQGWKPSLRPTVTQVEARGEINVLFETPRPYIGRVWVAVMRARDPHGPRAFLDRRNYDFVDVAGIPNGTIYFRAPQLDGPYEFRMYSRDSGEELAVLPFFVESPPEQWTRNNVPPEPRWDRMTGGQGPAAPLDAPIAGPAAVTTFAGGGSLEGRVYAIPKGTKVMPSFANLPQIGTLSVSRIDVPFHPYEEGFPGVDRKTWFAIDYTGSFQVARAGSYRFRLKSDDGSKLLVDGRLIINNDGIHDNTAADGEVMLRPGNHRIEVQYFQGPADYLGMQFFCAVPGGAVRIFPDCGLTL
jgi:hypothetical protein